MDHAEDVDQCGDEGRRGARGIEPEPGDDDRQERAEQRAADYDAD
jgi:hypothetical protein